MTCHIKTKERMCGNKKKYKDEQSAMAAAFRINAKLIDTQGCYKCHFCNFWHTGHNRNSGIVLNRKFGLVKAADPREVIDYKYSKYTRLKKLGKRSVEELLDLLKKLNVEIALNKENGKLRSSAHNVQNILRDLGVKIDDSLIVLTNKQMKEKKEPKV